MRSSGSSAQPPLGSGVFADPGSCLRGGAAEGGLARRRGCGIGSRYCTTTATATAAAGTSVAGHLVPAPRCRGRPRPQARAGEDPRRGGPRGPAMWPKRGWGVLGRNGPKNPPSHARRGVRAPDLSPDRCSSAPEARRRPDRDRRLLWADAADAAAPGAGLPLFRSKTAARDGRAPRPASANNVSKPEY